MSFLLATIRELEDRCEGIYLLRLQHSVHSRSASRRGPAYLYIPYSRRAQNPPTNTISTMTKGDTARVVSAKVSGKKRAILEDTVVTSAAPSPTPKSGMQTRQKRVLPSRSRRGGPGVGGCDVDVMILETRKRRCTWSVYAEGNPD